MKYFSRIYIILFALITIPFSCYASDYNKQLETNKKNVIAFYNAAFNHLDFDSASKYLGDEYKQHSPSVEDGKNGLKNFIQILQDKFPRTHVDIKRSFSDRDYVILHVNFIMNNKPGLAVIDIFKLKDGKIVEHWGVSQDIPEKSANTNGMF
jgi:predicted SnoaL-like aldol condensation-catalyzing enzyme